jgi:LysM repeat protein
MMAKQSPKIPCLVMQGGPHPKQVFPLSKSLLTIGRAEDNDIVINDAEVSRYHARLTWQGDKWVIEDLGSRNGTFINAQQITTPTILASGAQLRFGPDVVLGMQMGTPKASRSANKYRKSRPKWLLPVGLAGAVLAVLVVGVLAFLGYSYFTGNWPLGVSQDVDTGPIVVIQDPASGFQVANGEAFTVFVSSSDENGVVRIDLWVDDLLAISQTSPDENGITVFTLVSPMLAARTGTYAIIARAYDSLGAMGESAVHHVTVYEAAVSNQDLAQYTVQEGDTLGSIAGNAGTTSDAIGQANPSINNGQVKPGQRILVPMPPPASRVRAVPPPPPAKPPQLPPPAIQPSIKIKSLQVQTSPVFYGQACINEPLTTNVVATIDPAKNVKTATLNYAYYGKAGTSGVHSVPMVSIGGSDFGATINAGGEAEKFLAKDGGFADIWIDILDTGGKTSTSKPITVTVVNCANIVPPGGQQQPGGQAGALPGILPGFLPSGAGQAGQVGVFQPGQGPVAGIVANIMPQWNPANILPNQTTKLPESFKAELTADCEVALSWKDITNNETYYEVYRYDPGAPRSKSVANLPPDTQAYTDKVPQPGKYGYSIFVAGKEGNQIRLVSSGQLVWVTVPESQDCQPSPGFMRVFFRPTLLKPSDGSLTWGFLEATIKGLPTMRIPSASNVRTGDVSGYSTFLREAPAPAMVYTDPGSPLVVEVQGNATADSKKNPPTALGQFANSHTFADLTSSDAHTKIWQGSGSAFTATYKMWIENWAWGGGNTFNKKIPVPYDLSLTATSGSHKLTWEFDQNYNPKWLDGFIIYRNYICPGADVSMKFPLVVDARPQNASINISDAPLGCTCSYQVSAYGSEGESAPSKPHSEACKTNDPIDSVVVTFESLTINDKNLMNNISFNPTSASVQLFANESTRRSGIQLLEAKMHPLKDMLFNGKSDNNSIIVNLGRGNSLTVQISYYVSNVCKGKDVVINKQGDSWLSVEGSYQIFSGDGQCEMLVSIKGNSSAAGQASSGSATALSKDGEACNSTAQCKSGICEAGLCAPVYRGGEDAYCFFNSHCASSLCVCYDTDGKAVSCPKSPKEGDGGKCSVGLPLASRCTKNSQCGSGYCANKICAPEEPTGQIGDYCHHNNQCANDFCFCPDGWNGDFCSNYDANADFLNRRGACQFTPGSPNGYSCTEKNDCTSNYCANGVCAPKDKSGVDGEYCHHNNHCRSGTCACPSGKASFWTLGFCPDWEDFTNNSHGVCKP